MFEAGQVFADRYRVERLVAKGGMGTVYEAVHVETDRPCALKVLHAASIGSAELRERFRREARVTARIQSEYIVDVLDAGIDAESDTPYIVMELLRGSEVGKLLRQVGRFEPPEVVTILSQVARALDKTHAAAIVHRDLKPANLFLTHREDGTPVIKILDFGIAKAMTQDGSLTTQSLGSPLYMAPEQLDSKGVVTLAADVYAMGMIAYALLVGAAYWQPERKQAPSPIAFALATLAGPKVSPVERARERDVELPSAFDAWFFTACAVDASKRWPSAGAAAEELAAALDSTDAFETRRSIPPSSTRGLNPSAAARIVPESDPTPVRVELSPETGGGAFMPSSGRGGASGAPLTRGLMFAAAGMLLLVGALAAVAVRRGSPSKTDSDAHAADGATSAAAAPATSGAASPSSPASATTAKASATTAPAAASSPAPSAEASSVPAPSPVAASVAPTASPPPRPRLPRQPVIRSLPLHGRD